MHHRAPSTIDEVMDRAARRMMTGTERPYDIASDARDDVHPLEDYRGPAYTIWAEITDLFDDPRGPESESLCNDIARQVSVAWLEARAMSDEAVDRFFKDWDPWDGKHFRAAAGWPPKRR